MKTCIVVARSLNHVIGRSVIDRNVSGRNVSGQHGEIPWRVKGEQKLFKHITMGGVLIMGRKTWESIGRPLPGRETVIVTRNADYRIESCHIALSLAAALEVAADMNRPVFVVGGGEIYRQALPIVDGVHISTIDTTVDGDVLFPTFPTSDFRLIKEEHFTSNINYVYQYYERR